tara:strand:+ start:65 stop:544 length:480 start_codon:yes stop_codon:yes gene_type:complete
MKIKTEKNFLNQEDFINLKNEILVSPFYFTNNVSSEGAKDGYYFTHTIFDHSQILSESIFKLIIPILNKLEAKALYKTKINLYPQTHKILEHGQHTDTSFKCKAFILAFNTCDGYTRIGKNKIIPSIENQGIFFEGNVPHNSTTCTDQNIRLNININYF